MKKAGSQQAPVQHQELLLNSIKSFKHIHLSIEVPLCCNGVAVSDSEAHLWDFKLWIKAGLYL
jgi:hypothetical protein